MLNSSWLATLIALTLALAGCTGLIVEPLGAVGQVVSVPGVVRSIDISPMAYDGPAEIVLDSELHGRVSVYVQSCFGGCALVAVEQLDHINPGETWQATGEIVERGELAIYTDTLHSLEPR